MEMKEISSDQSVLVNGDERDIARGSWDGDERDIVLTSGNPSSLSTYAQ
jgi:hypothetical protein